MDTRDYDGCYVKIEDRGRKVILDLPVKSNEDTTCMLSGGSRHTSRPVACRLFPSSGGRRLSMGYPLGYCPTCPGIGREEGGQKEAGGLVAEQFLEGRISRPISKAECLRKDSLRGGGL